MSFCEKLLKEKRFLILQQRSRSGRTGVVRDLMGKTKHAILSCRNTARMAPI